MESPTSYEEILKFIVYKCRENNNPVADSLVAYVLNIQYDDNEEDFYFKSNDRLPESKAQELIVKTMHLLELKEDGILETLKLQVTYELAHVKEEDKVEQIKTFFDSEINNLIKEITSFQNTSKKDYDSIQIHKKIFSFLLIKTRQNTLNSLNDFTSNLTNQTLGISSEREIYAILDNVLPKSGLPPFVSLSSQDKIAQLNDLSNIVMGIRLLNGEIGKGGIGLLTLNDMRKRLNSDLSNDVKQFYNNITEICEKYTLIYENIDFSVIVDKYEFEVLEKIRKFIIYYRQAMTYLSMLMDDLHNSSTIIDTLSINYDKEIKFLIEIVDKKSAISKEQAYPRFENLAKMYSKFQEQVFILNIRENVYHKLYDFITNNDIPPDFNEKYFEERFDQYLENLDIYAKLMQEQAFSFESGLYQNGVTVLLPHTTADFLDIKLEFQGFCLVTLLKKHGLLVNGKPSVVTKFKDKYMVFYNHTSVQDFIDNPDFFLDEIFSYVRKHAYLINLLNMTDDFPMANLSILFRDKDMYTYKYKNSSVMVDKDIQTPVHFYENGLIDRNYVWNEWELKKQALQLADIMKKKTVSCQTILSHFRRENETQVWPPKDEGSNTTVSKGTNLSIEKSYINGLRKYDNKY